jgi:hypothetical protein
MFDTNFFGIEGFKLEKCKMDRRKSSITYELSVIQIKTGYMKDVIVLGTKKRKNSAINVIDKAKSAGNQLIASMISSSDINISFKEIIWICYKVINEEVQLYIDGLENPSVDCFDSNRLLDELNLSSNVKKRLKKWIGITC